MNGSTKFVGKRGLEDIYLLASGVFNIALDPLLVLIENSKKLENPYEILQFSANMDEERTAMV